MSTYKCTYDINTRTYVKYNKSLLFEYRIIIMYINVVCFIIVIL